MQAAVGEPVSGLSFAQVPDNVLELGAPPHTHTHTHTVFQTSSFSSCHDEQLAKGLRELSQKTPEQSPFIHYPGSLQLSGAHLAQLFPGKPNPDLVVNSEPIPTVWECLGGSPIFLFMF